MANKVWCSDIYDLNSSNTTLSYDHDNLYREYAATSIGDLIDRMQDRLKDIGNENYELTQDNNMMQGQIYEANKVREKVLQTLTDSINLLDNAKDVLNE